MTTHEKIVNIADSNQKSLAIDAFANPMIDTDGDTYKVSSALNFLSNVLRKDDLRLEDPADTFGLAVILDSCAAALRRMAEKQD